MQEIVLNKDDPKEKLLIAMSSKLRVEVKLENTPL